MKLLVLFIILLFNTYAKDITPYKYITASHPVSTFVVVDNIVIIGTEEGVIDIIDMKTNKLIDQITLPKTKNIWNEDMRSLIFSVDYQKGRLIFISRLLSGWREFYVYENKKLTKLIDESKHLTLQKVKFIDENRAIIGTMSNEILLYDIKKKQIIYKKQLDYASFSDLVLTEDKKYFFMANESPLTYKIEASTGDIIEKYYKGNKRDIFSIDYKNNTLITGGKDRRVVLYQTSDKYDVTKGDFFIYSVGLNPDASKAAFVKNEDNDISIINTKYLEEIYLLKGHKQTVIQIDFYKENELITADENDRLMFWKLE